MRDADIRVTGEPGGCSGLGGPGMAELCVASTELTLSSFQRQGIFLRFILMHIIHVLLYDPNAL